MYFVTYGCVLYTYTLEVWISACVKRSAKSPQSFLDKTRKTLELDFPNEKYKLIKFREVYGVRDLYIFFDKQVERATALKLIRFELLKQTDYIQDRRRSL